MAIQATGCGIKIHMPESIHEEMAGAELSEKPLRLLHLGGALLMEFAAEADWTMERVRVVLDGACACKVVNDAFGADAYIGTEWIGSTEV